MNIDLKLLVKKINELCPDVSPTLIEIRIKPVIDNIIREAKHQALRSGSSEAVYSIIHKEEFQNKLLTIGSESHNRTKQVTGY